MQTWVPVLAIVGSLVTGLIRYRMRLGFLRDTFSRSGDRRDLEVAGKVTAPGWLALGDRRPPRAGSQIDDDQDPIERVLEATPNTPA